MENKQYPGSYYQPLFDLMRQEHGTILTESALTDIIEVVEKMRGANAPTGPRWVRAHKGLTPDGVHRMKFVSKDNVVMRGTGLVTNNIITLIAFLNKTTMGVDDLSKDYEGIYYLDESAMPAAGREEDAVEVKIPVSIALYEFVRDCAQNWDCDMDGHKYETGCRKCEAKGLYEILKQEREGK